MLKRRLVDKREREHNPSMEENLAAPLTVIHLLDAAGGEEQLWGKERVVLWLAQAQRESGNVTPLVRTLTPKLLTSAAMDAGLDSSALTTASGRSLWPYARVLKRELAIRPAMVHSHGYKANLVARLARLMGARSTGWIATCHGWVETSAPLRLYNALDRGTSRLSDLVTVPSDSMLSRLHPGSVAVPNGIPDRPLPSNEQRESLRRAWGIERETIVAGILGRLSPEKGVDDLLKAVCQSKDDRDVAWVLAGTGPLEATVRQATQSLANLKYLGYVDGSEQFLPGIDVYVQPSRTEGLSLGLLEAARAGLAIVATRVGATEWAVRDKQEAILIAPNDPGLLSSTVTRVAGDAMLRNRLGRQARLRFEETLDIRVMHRRYLELYQMVLAKRRRSGHNAVSKEITK